MGNKSFRQAEGNDRRGVRMEQVTEVVKAETTGEKQINEKTEKTENTESLQSNG